MSTEKNLKQSNVVNLWLFFTFNVVLFLLFFYPEFTKIFSSDLKNLLTFRSSGIVVAPIILFVINGLLTSDQKAFLVYWKLRDTLPGHRAFTKYALEDPRVELNRLNQLHGPLPRIPKAQNVLWYKIYRTNKDEFTVRNSHKAFLLGRDLCVQAFLFLLLSVGMLFFSNVDHPWVYCVIVVGEFMLMIRLAQNHGRQFVRNVLAVESTK
jgi:hypothetical protein